MKKILIIGGCFFLLDFITKRLVIWNFDVEQSISIIGNFFRLTYVQNTGVAFSFLEGQQIFIILMTILFLGFIWFYLKRAKILVFEMVGYGLVIGGAFGNLVDRIWYGYVIDFFDFLILGYHFPIFNVADCGVVIGVLILLVGSFFEKRGVS